MQEALSGLQELNANTNERKFAADRQMYFSSLQDDNHEFCSTSITFK